MIVGGDNGNTITARTSGYGSETWIRGGSGADGITGVAYGGNHFIGGGGGDTIGGGYNSFNEYCLNNAAEGGLYLPYFDTDRDHFSIYAGGFGGDLTAGETLTSGYNFIEGDSSVANTSTFLFTPQNGTSPALLSFDSDGTGPAAPVLLATVGDGRFNYSYHFSPNNISISGSPA